MSENARKAVITTAQVQEALNSYTKTLAIVAGTNPVTLEFDKGARGKGFAVYTKDGAVMTSFETKEEAFTHYSRWVEVATEVLALQQTRKPEETEPAKAPSKTATKASEKPAA